MKFDDCSDEELAAELLRRKDCVEQAARAARLARWETMTRERIDCIAPDHSLASCSDVNTYNGISSHRKGRTEARCSRCALLDLLDTGDYAADFDFEVIVRVFSVKPV